MTSTKGNFATSIMNKQLNVTAILVSAIIIYVLVKLLTLLPERYYFGFSKVVEPSSSTAFLITPPHVNIEKYNEILAEHGYLDPYQYYEDQAPEQASEDTDPKESIRKVNSDIIDSGQYHFWISLLLKLLPPFVAGYFLFFVWKTDAMSTIPIGSALTAFLLCWPLIVLWDRVVYGEWYDQKYLFFVLYISYILIYYNVARLGCILAKISLEAGFVKAGKIEVDWGKTFSSLLTTGVTVTITWIVTTTIAKA